MLQKLFTCHCKATCHNPFGMALLFAVVALIVGDSSVGISPLVVVAIAIFVIVIIAIAIVVVVAAAFYLQFLLQKC